MWPIVGHERAVALLEKGIAQGAVAHAYLFVGPPQVGKGTLALNLAQALNCQGETPPCGACPSCRRIATGLHPDVQVIALGGEGVRGRPRTELGIDLIRDLQHTVALKPFEGRCRVFIIDGAERLSLEAANCLLKTLEEPPPQVVLVLLAAEAERLLPTILSRCQRLDLSPLPQDSVLAALETRWGASPETAHLLARLSGGRLGWAVGALGHPEVLQDYQEERDRFAGLAWVGLAQRLALADELARRARDGLLLSLRMWLGWWRDLLLVKGEILNSIANCDTEAELRRQGKALALDQVLAFLRALVQAQDEIGLNVNPQLCLEALMLKLPRLQEAR